MLEKSSTFWLSISALLITFTAGVAYVIMLMPDAHYRLIYGNLFGSFLIGLIGALCFCWGIKYEFIESTTKGVPSYMATSLDMLLFCSLGGLVALVFQSPQADTLTPIQAFVLGATWPSVVNRVIAGNAQQKKDEVAQVGALLSSPTPLPVPTPTGAQITTPTNVQELQRPTAADA
jgi:hypothetical protein